MQHEITAPTPLLDGKGHLTEPGWARRPLWEYTRKGIRAPRYRIKEWDYYLVGNGRFAAALTVADNGYMGLASVSLLDFTRPWEHTASAMTPFPMGRTGMPPASWDGDVGHTGKTVTIYFEKTPGNRRLRCEYRRFCDGKDLLADITLAEPEQDTIVMAIPFAGKPRHFYYNQKINCMPASGTARFGDEVYTFSPEDSFGTLDWGRGVWPYRNAWYWSSLSAAIDGAPFGFNLGYGFGDLTAATENALFYGGKAHKLGRVEFHLPDGDLMKPWAFTSDDGRLEMEMRPVIDRAARTSLGILESDQHQVFGRFTGKAVLDDRTALAIDDLPGFAEKVINKW